MQRPIPILMYHSISDQASPAFRPWTLSPAVFDDHLGYLRAQGCQLLNVGQLAALLADPSQPLPERPVVITFDDGLADFYENALPVLDKHAAPATLYVTAGYAGKTSVWLEPEGEGRRPMMTWAQIRDAASRVEMGAHTLTHPQLDTLPNFRAADEIGGSKALLEDQLGAPVTTFAYPHGYHSRQTRELVRRAGFTSACAVKHGLSSTGDDPLALARIIVYRDTSPEALADLMQGRGLAAVTQRERITTTGWRQVRRLKAGWKTLRAALRGLAH